MGTQLPLPKKEKRGRSPPNFRTCRLWPNDWMDQDGTWYEGEPWSRPHCIRWGPSALPKKGAEPPPQFSAHFWATVCKTVRPVLLDRCPVLSDCPVMSVTVHCCQTVGRIKMKFGTQIGLDPGHNLLDGDSTPPPQGAQAPIFGPYLLRPNVCPKLGGGR